MSRQSAFESYRAGADVYAGATLCKQKAEELHEEHHLPKGLLPLIDFEEVGYNRSTSSVCLLQKNATTYIFKKSDRTSWYAPEVTTFVEDCRMRKMTGVKIREMMAWFTLSGFFIDEKDPERITFKTTGGPSRSLPV